MKIYLTQKVPGNYKNVKTLFNEKLLEKLSLPGSEVLIQKFEGTYKGAKFIFYIKLFGLFEIPWKGVISANQDKGDYVYFTDVGESIPFPLESWTHEHGFKNLNETHTLLVDKVEYTCKYKIFELLTYPIWYIYFLGRKFLYTRYIR